MDIAAAYRLLARRSVANRAEVFPLRPGSMACDPWPFAAAAAVALTGWLEDCEGDADLDDALRQFESLFYGGIVSREQWAKTIVEVAAAARAAKKPLGAEQ